MISPNPALRKLGFDHDARVVIIHADDVGMCQASVSAMRELLDFGLVSSVATMVPCSWFPAVAAYCRQKPQADVGVHLTLTAEWDVYRWGPISTSDPATGLMDGEGYFYRTTKDAHENGDVEAVRREVFAQIERALSAGINVTHIDTHMGTMLQPRYMAVYIEAALKYRLPLMFPRWDEARLRAEGIDGERLGKAQGMIDALEQQGMPLVDHIAGMSLDGDKLLELARKALSDLKPGITHFIIHPSLPTPELRELAGDWGARAADYEHFMCDELREFVRDQGLHVVGYRTLRDLLRSEKT